MLDVDEVNQRLIESGRTRKWVADFCGIEVDSLNHILAGRRKASRPVLKLLALALECDLSAIARTERRADLTHRKVAAT